MTWICVGLRASLDFVADQFQDALADEATGKANGHPIGYKQDVAFSVWAQYCCVLHHCLPVGLMSNDSVDQHVLGNIHFVEGCKRLRSGKMDEAEIEPPETPGQSIGHGLAVAVQIREILQTET
ncbi:MAG: hypothetical protein RIR97_822, partial [Pseudomonadota bacterium]